MSTAAAKHPIGFLARKSVAWLLLIALVLFLFAIVIAAYPTYTFARNMFRGITIPLEQFDSGETLVLDDDDPHSSYLLSMEVNERNGTLPPMEVEILTSERVAPVTSTINRWNSVMGREYKQFLVIEPPADGQLTFTIQTERSEDFFIHREMDDVFRREIKRSTPLWLVALLPMLGAVALLVMAMMRMINATSSVDLRVE